MKTASEPVAVLSVSCPNSSTYASPDHGLTFCNGAASAPRATSCGPSLAIPDYHHQYTESTGLWTTDACHTPDCGSVALAFYLTISYWASHPVEQLSADNFAAPVAAAFSSLRGFNRFGLPDYFVAPHSLFTSTARILLKLFRGTDLLVEGFGPGAYSGAVITNIAFSHANFQAMLVSLGGVAMHIPTLTSCLNHFKNHHLQVEEVHEAYTTGMQQNVSHRPDGPPPSPKYVLILAQHVRDRRAPWRLNDVLAAHLFNHGIRLITLHDKIEHQRARAETRELPFVPSSKFGRYRHDYEWLIPSLKFFSPSTLLTRSFQPFAYDELENYESAVSSQYSTDLQDILSALLSLWGSPPLPSFAADPEGLGYLLVHGIHRWPEDLARFIHIEPAPFLHCARWDFPTLMSMLSNWPRAALFLLCHYCKPLTTFIPNSSQAFALRPRPAALSLVTKCSTPCAANLTPSPADSLALAKPCNRFYLPHFGVG